MVKKEVANENFDCDDTTITTDIAMQNVRNMKERTIQQSKILRSLLEKGTIKIMGAMHDLATGIVTFE